MFDADLLKPNAIDMLKDDFLRGVRESILSGNFTVSTQDPYTEFKNKFHHYVENNTGFKLNNIKDFAYKEIIIGCHHFIDALLIKHGNDLQVLEHDYTYYQRLNPTRKWSIPGQLIPNQPLIIATPFPGYLGIHPQYHDILDEAKDKNISVHLDGAWLSCSKDVEIDLGHSAIASIGISLSKGYGANWNRIGIRYTKTQIATDPITIFDKARMCPRSTVNNGILLLENIPMDYMWNTYGERYDKAIEQFDLDKGNILFAAYGKDRIIYSLSKLLTND